MINKAVDNAVLDAVLEKAFADAFEREMEELEKMPVPDKEMPEKYKRIERRYYNKKMGIPSRGYKVFCRAAACVLIVISVGFSVMMLSPEIRASVWDSVVEFYETYMEFSFMGRQKKSVQIGEYTLGYVPRGFILDTEKKSRVGIKYRFVNADGDAFIVSHYAANNSDVKYDNEERMFEKIQINGTDACAVEYESGECILIWESTETLFTIDGNIPLREMIKIAENIS